jgi:hypothetical protein
MYTLIRYPIGVTVEAVILATGKNRMRVVIPGLPDTIELRRAGSQWFDSDRQPVEFDFLMCADCQDRAVVAPASASVARSAAD